MNNKQDYIECTIPILPVNNLQNSIDYYSKVLEFTINWVGDVVAQVTKNGCPIMLSQSLSDSSGAWVWIGLRDDTLFEFFDQKVSKYGKSPKITPGHMR